MQLYGTTTIYNSTGKTIIWLEICVLITRIGSAQSRVVCYWYTSEVKEGKLKYKKERIRKTSQTMQLNRELKGRKLNIRKRNLKEY